METSLITPPVGVSVFMISGVVRDVPMYTIFRGILPFFMGMLVCLILLILIPSFTLYLPGTMSR